MLAVYEGSFMNRQLSKTVINSLRSVLIIDRHTHRENPAPCTSNCPVTFCGFVIGSSGFVPS